VEPRKEEEEEEEVTNQNCINEEVKRRLSSGNACCSSVRNVLSSRLLSQRLKKKALPLSPMGPSGLL
jgi:hypothetical protein